MEKTERAGLQVKMDVLLQTAEESYLLGSDAWYGKLRDVVYALYEQKEIPLEMLIKAERRLGQLEMDVRLAGARADGPPAARAGTAKTGDRAGCGGLAGSF